MVASVVRRPWYRFRANGAQVELAADPVQNEALEGQITTVLDVELASEITLATNVTADLYAIEQDAATITAQFSGRVNQLPADSYPNRVGYLCTGPLARLRRVTVGGRNLTGMTDGEAVQEILDSCNVAFDPADIQDAGYVLGAQTAVHWVKDQPAHEILAEIDRVFGMATIEVGAGRVVRFAYDRAPDAADISVTYTRGVDAEFWRNSRVRGDLDAIVNVVQVTGASWEDAAGCTRTPWSRGVADNADLGTGVRNRSLPFSSDLIQDEALAGWKAEQLLEWGNRQPDTLTLVALNDPNVNCGDVIGVKDPAYGITLTADATATPYLVLTIVRRGEEMTLTCVGGAAGATGTITTGVEKVCNQTSTDVNIPGLFTPPAISVPPAITVGTYDCATDGGPNGVCPDAGGGGTVTDLLGINIVHWVDVNPTLSTGTGKLVTSQIGTAYASTYEIDLTQDWAITATCEMKAAASSHEMQLGVGNATAVLKYGVELWSTGVGGFLYVNSDNADIPNGPWTDDDQIDISLSWDAATLTLSATIVQTSISGTRTETLSVVDSLPLPTYTLYPVIGSSGTSGDTGGIEVDAISLEAP